MTLWSLTEHIKIGPKKFKIDPTFFTPKNLKLAPNNQKFKNCPKKTKLTLKNYKSASLFLDPKNTIYAPDFVFFEAAFNCRSIKKNGPIRNLTKYK